MSTTTTPAPPPRPSIQIRVLAASTGVTYPISLHPDELTVANIRRHLAGAVPPNDQILLLGPPYKVPKDSSLRSDETLAALRLGDEEDGPNGDGGNGGDGGGEGTAPSSGGDGEGGGGGGGGIGGGGGTGRRILSSLSAAERTGSKRLFLFSKRALSDSAPDPPPCVLGPLDVALPTVPDSTPVIFPRDAAGNTISPLHQALEVYERRFMLHLCRGRALADAAELRIESCRECVSERAVMARALRAAVSNLADHRNGAARTRAEFASTFRDRTASHARLLGGFEGHVAALADVPLHPALVTAARTSGRVMGTLLDTVPAERERNWAARCADSHRRLLALRAELDEAFARVGTPSDLEEEARGDVRAEDAVREAGEEVETAGAGMCRRQAERLGRLMSDHGEAVRVVTEAIAGAAEAQGAFAALESMSEASSSVLPAMEQDDALLRDLTVRIANGKTEAMRRMRARLRQVSVSQSAIQRAVSNVAVLREALQRQSEAVSHLEHVSALPSSYRDFLSELRRRRAYGEAVAAASRAASERLAAMRADETRSRERFLRGSGRHLMPAFFEVLAPTLASHPPSAPVDAGAAGALGEMDALPDVGPAEGGAVGSSSLGSGDEGAPQKHVTAGGQGGVSSASTLTDGSQPPSQEDKAEEAGDAKGGTGTAEGQQPLPSTEEKRAGRAAAALIVSADESGGGGGAAEEDGGRDQDVIMETAITEEEDRAATAAAAAERKALAYENAALRQALERMGGKGGPTSMARRYVEEAREAIRREDRAEEERRRAELDALRERGDANERERAELTSRLEESNAELERVRRRLEGAERALLRAKSRRKDGKPCDRISHSSFDVGDVGLFMPTGMGSGGKRTYLAFHSNRPHRYLSTDSIVGTPDYVLGRIVYQEELVAGALGTDSNPYGLHVGTKFWVLTVEVLKVP